MGTNILLKTKISEMTCQFVIDTGACATIISTALFNKISDDEKLELRPVDPSVRLEVADDGLLPIDGITTIDIQIGTDIFQWDVFVATIREDGLLGLDFLHNFDYNPSKNGLKLKGKKYETVIENVPLRAVRVICNKDIVLPAQSECLVSGIKPDGQIFKSKLGQFVKSSLPFKGISDSLFIGNTVFNAEGMNNGCSIPVRMINISTEDITIKEGLTLGYAEALHECELTVRRESLS